MYEEPRFTFYEVMSSLKRGIEAENGHNKIIRPGIYLLDTQLALAKAFRDASRESGRNWRELKMKGQLTTYPIESVAEALDQLSAQATSPINRVRNTVNRGGITSRAIMVAEQILTSVKK